MSIHDLDKEIARRKSLMPQEPIEVSIPDRYDVIVQKALNGFDERQKKAIQYAESIRPEFDVLPDVIGCEIHEFVERVKMFEETVQSSFRSGYFVAAYSPCRECAEERKIAAGRRKWLRKGVPERVIDATFENFDVDMPEKIAARDAVKRWMARPGGFLILFGTMGTGKGHLAAACLRHGIEEIVDDIPHRVFDGIFIVHQDMLTDLRSSYTTHTTSELIDSWRETPLLVIDELGLSSGGSDEGPMLYQVLADRHDKRRKVIITSNLELGEIKKVLGLRLVDRIGEDREVIAMRWPSKRTGR